MTTYLFVTKPDWKPQRVKGRKRHGWSCARTTQLGDKILTYVTGQGISYEWRATSIAEPDSTWKYYCYVEHIADIAPPITIQELRQVFLKKVWAPPHLNFRGIKAIIIPDKIVERIRGLRSKSSPKSLRSLVEVERELAAQLKASSQRSPTERRKRLLRANKQPRSIEVTTTVFIRNSDVIEEVLLRADGHCERCKVSAPFPRASDGSPYLEVHHRKRLADGGEDTTKNALALCPNCHRQAHYG